MSTRLAATYPPAPLAEVKPHHGTPTLFIDGQAISAFAYVGDVAEHCRQMAEAGLRLNSFVSRCQYAFYPDSPDPDGDRRRIEEHDATVRRVVRAWPEVLFFPRLQLETPPWWAKRYPDEVACFDAGGGEIKPILTPKHGIPSWVSMVWREQTAAALRGYIDHVRQSEFGGRFVGYHLAAGTSAEWMSHGANGGLFVDYSPPGVRHFRAWLREHYRNDEDVLRRSWRDADVTFDTATIPSREKRAAFAGSYLLDPREAQPVIDYCLSFSDQTVDAIAFLARAVKEHTARRSTVGAFYGYVLQLCNEQRQQNAGHNAIDRLLACPDVDFIASPFHYGDRRIGEGYASFMPPIESVRLHGKLYYGENDFLSPLCSRGAADSQAKDVQQYAEVLKFAHAAALTNGVAQWLLAFNEPWYADPELQAVLKRQQEIEKEALGWDRASVSDVAVIVDDASQVYQPAANVLPEFKRESASEMLIYDLPPRFGRCGAGVDWVLLDDLGQLRPYKLYIVLNAFALDERKRALVKWRLCRGGATVLWMWAPGAIAVEAGRGGDKGGVSPDAVADLVGMKVKMATEAAAVRVRFESGDDALLQGAMRSIEGMGNEHAIAPRFWIDDPAATVLARFAEDDKPAVAVRRFAEWTSVYCAAPLTLDEHFIREVARAAGAHVYYEGPDATYIGPGLIGLHAATAGRKVIRLPRRAATIRELYRGEIVGRDADHIEMDLRQYETVLLRFEASASQSAS